MKEILFALSFALLCQYSYSQVEQVKVYNPIDYGNFASFYDVEVFEDDMIVGGFMEDEDSDRYGTIVRIDKMGNVKWSTLDQFAERVKNRPRTPKNENLKSLR